MDHPLFQTMYLCNKLNHRLVWRLIHGNGKEDTYATGHDKKIPFRYKIVYVI